MKLREGVGDARLAPLQSLESVIVLQGVVGEAPQKIPGPGHLLGLGALVPESRPFKLPLRGGQPAPRLLKLLSQTLRTGVELVESLNLIAMQLLHAGRKRFERRNALAATAERRMQFQRCLDLFALILRPRRLVNLPLQSGQFRLLTVQGSVFAPHFGERAPGISQILPFVACETRTDVRHARIVEIDSSPHVAPKSIGQIPVAFVVNQKTLNGEPVKAELPGVRQRRTNGRLTVPRPDNLPSGAAHGPARIAAQEFRFQVQVTRVAAPVDFAQQIPKRPAETALADGVGPGDDVHLVARRLEGESRLDAGQGMDAEAAQPHQAGSLACASSFSRAR